MKKKILLAVIVATLLLCIGTAFAFKNIPQGFRGLKWGDPPGENMELLQKVNQRLSFYVIRDEELILDRVNLYMIIYSFYTPSETEKKFMNVSCYFQGERDYQLIRTICKERFGEADRGTYLWRDWRGIVSIDYGFMRKGMLTLASHKIWTEYLDQKAKKKSEEAEGEW